MDVLHLKKGARVCLVNNINTIDELVNGVMGTVIGFERNKFGKIEAVIVKFDQESTGQQQRACYPELSKKYEDQMGTPIFKKDLEYHIPTGSGKRHAPRARVLQFPFFLAYANTSHKMQGVTIKTGSVLVVHWGKFQPGMAYVMLGRCESLEDVHITGDFNKDQIKCSPEALEEANRISEIVRERNDSAQALDSLCLNIGCLNVRSLQAHFDDVKGLEPLMKCDIFALVETWIPAGVSYNFEGFEGTFVSAPQSQCRGKGLAVFTKLKNITTETHLAETFSAAMVKSRPLDMNFIFLYLKSNSFVWSEVKELLDKWIKPKKTIIMGDMNWDWLETHPMKTYIIKKRFSQLVEESTHDEGRLIDHAYCNVDSIAKISQCSVTFSDHDLICLSLPKDKINMNC